MEIKNIIIVGIVVIGGGIAFAFGCKWAKRRNVWVPTFGGLLFGSVYLLVYIIIMVIINEYFKK